MLQALADPTRRRIVERLGIGPASVTALAAPIPMSLPAVVQHLQVLEGCGLVASEKVGRVRTCRLEMERLDMVQDWLATRRQTWITASIGSVTRWPRKARRPVRAPPKTREE